MESENDQDSLRNERVSYFEVEKVQNEDGFNDIYFGVGDDPVDFPDYIVDFKDEVEKFIAVIQLLYSDSSSNNLYAKYYDRLYYLADLAFNSPTEKVKLAERSLIKLKADLTIDVGQRLRTKLLLDYLRLSIWPSLVMLIVFLFGDAFFSWAFDFLGKTQSKIYISNLGLISIASMAGGWLSTATATRNLDYSDIISVINNQRGIIVRLLFINVFSIFVSILMIGGFLTINIGGLDSKNIVDNSTSALAFGFLLGFLDKFFVDHVESKLSKIDIK